ncbi:ABC transporter substrate-binding protein [Bacillaceae bacterium C204]|uniref:ABC transporter substrate-binding protein n=1 Tax=Neobacillus sp. 204 TaxID=3383351 RepID=UPI00397AACCB
MNKKRLIKSCVFLMIMTMLFLTACNQQSATSNGKVTITFSVAEYDSQIKPEMQDLIKRFEKANPKIQVKLLVSNWNDYHDRLVTWISGNQAPDIANLSGLWLGEFKDMNAIQPVDSYASSDFLKGFVQGPLDSFKDSNGKLSGLPFFLDPRVLYYRKDLFAQNHLSAPKTWDDIYKDAKVLTSTSNVYGFGVGGKYPNVMTGLEYFYFNSDSNVTASHFGPKHQLLYNSPEGIKSLDFLNKLVKENLTNPNPNAVEWENGVQPIFQAGKVGMMITGPWFASMLDQAKIQYGMVPIPTAEPGMKSRAVMQPDVLSVMTTDSSKKAGIEKFLQFIYQPENRLNFAVKHGAIPELNSVLNDSKWYNLPNNKFFASLVPTAINKYEDVGKYGDQMDHVVTDEIQKVYLQQQIPAQALKTASQKVKDLYSNN